MQIYVCIYHNAIIVTTSRRNNILSSLHTQTHSHTHTLTGGGLGMRPLLSPAAIAASLFTRYSGLYSESFFAFEEESSPLSSLEMTMHVGGGTCPMAGVTDRELVRDELRLEPERLFFLLICIKMAVDHHKSTALTQEHKNSFWAVRGSSFSLIATVVTAHPPPPSQKKKKKKISTAYISHDNIEYLHHLF